MQSALRHSTGQRYTAGVTLFLFLLVWSILGDLRAERGARGIPVGIFRVTPKLTAAYSFEDNLLKTKDDKVSDSVVTLTPVVVVKTHWRKLAVTLTATSNIARHLKREMENYADKNVAVELEMKPTKRLKLNVQGFIASNHSSRGAPDTGGQSTSEPPSTYTTFGGKAIAAYTLNKYRGQVTLSHDVDTQKDVGRYWQGIEFKLMHALGNKTNVSVNVGMNRHVYDDAALLRDGSEYKYGVGLALSPKAQISGNIQVGQTFKTLDDNGALDASAMTLSSSLTWKPAKRTNVTLNTSRGFNEGGTTGDYFINTDASLSVRHSLRSFLSVNGSLGLSRSEHSIDQEDDTWTLSSGFAYQFPKWVSLNGSYTFTDKQSSAESSSYNSNQFMFSLAGGL
ncbi:outer membrane beta-barrel protein [Magnetococcus sp. PR-3]|uniref:outer membrane beta-barrel protein n=1 Tax=Magnetococcus sp. PR-3 TaxID=3120355 RepID=UPI002FCDE63B